jgi:Fic family protein
MGIGLTQRRRRGAIALVYVGVSNTSTLPWGVHARSNTQFPENAHRFPVTLAARAQRKVPVDTGLILDLYEALFRPSVDAGITDSAALRGWRNSSVGLRGWRHVPPNPKKIRDLIVGLESLAARTDLAPIARALLVHLEFVTIHPFLDGNGRLGRLLMNQVLLSAGLPWVTIRSDERLPFFKAIEQAQVDADAAPFILFVWHLIRQSALELQAKQSGRKAAQR